MTRITAAARAARPGQWIIVAGGWTEQQFTERRRPTQAELTAAMDAAGEHPAYVQLFYSAALLNPAGFAALGIAKDSDVPPRGKMPRTAWTSSGSPSLASFALTYDV